MTVFSKRRPAWAGSNLIAATPPSGGSDGFAGRWSVWGEQGTKRLFTSCVMTTAANELVAPLHDRMPAIRAREDDALWFDHDAPPKGVHARWKPCPAELMAVSEANVLVNSPKNEGPRPLDPAE